MQRQFDHAIGKSPRQGAPAHLLGNCRSDFPCAPRASSVFPFIASLNSLLHAVHPLDLIFHRAAITSRFSFPFTVNIPLSIENASSRTQNARTCL